MANKNGWLAFFAGAALIMGACSEDDAGLSAEDNEEEAEAAAGEWNVFDNTDKAIIRVILRDFSAEHQDFENFSDQASGNDFRYGTPISQSILAYGLPGYGEDWAARSELHNSCPGNRTGVAIGADGLPMVKNPSLPSYLQKKVSTEPAALEYGECGDRSRGFVNATADLIAKPCSAPGSWYNEIYVVTGMVKPHLKFDVPKKGAIDMFEGVHIQKAADLCDNGRFDEWFADVPDVNYRINKTLKMKPEPGTGFYQVYSDYNTGGGYFPLDDIDKNYNYKGPVPCDEGDLFSGNTECKQFGPQSLAIFCPPYNYEYADSQTDYMGYGSAGLCTAWHANGGPKKGKAAAKAVEKYPDVGQHNLRNYHFTTMGYFEFQYKPSEGARIDFISGNDLWVFVDGVLVVDLGGTHLPAPGHVDIELLAKNNHGCHEGEPLAEYTNCTPDAKKWKEGTWHHVHFFAASRQTNGADFGFRLNLPK